MPGHSSLFLRRLRKLVCDAGHPRLSLAWQPKQDVDGRDEPGHDERACARYAPGKSRIRLATMPSITSLVPPSIELALVRSQARGRAAPFERALSHFSASMPPADISIS